ncbi:alkaline phosphatase D family protein [Novosphingobium sp.]|uniref:alkaline phosphatase D family protein n=1 Tax=Novosphingobium sp. TaxID=1874826 RepID=UPI00261EFC1A|nr:alkaline phosphatase D family protein [Novosphingobium sp.]
MTLSINRRNLLAAMGAGTGIGLAPAAIAAAKLKTATFRHGVASGDPAADGAVIWTRASVAEGASGDVPLTWHVAISDTAKPLKSGKITATAAADHTAKVEVSGLKPATEYWYWFRTADGKPSPKGRFRTLPVGKTDKLVIALTSCALYPGGYFNAYADLATQERVDAVLHLGDYIYEYGAEGYGADIGKRLNRLPDPTHEIVTLSDYRRRHAQVKADPQMQAAHARAAFICVWDDHETANDSWLGGAENHDPAKEGDWRARKAAALQAYFEWMPIRNPKAGADPAAINRSFEFGDLATLAMVETRLLARSEQIASKVAAPDMAQVTAMLAARNDPSREMLGAAQLQWLESLFAKSVKAGKPWQLLGNQVVMARVPGPDLRAALGDATFEAMLAKMPEAYRGQIARSQAAFKAGIPFNMDAWDGYPPARERLYASMRKIGANPLAFAGDSHAAWANDLYDNGGTRIGAEFGATAITSPSYGSLLPGLGKIIAAQSPEVAFCDQDMKGYTMVTITPDAAVADFVTVSTVFAPEYKRGMAARFEARKGAALKALS